MAPKLITSSFSKRVESCLISHLNNIKLNIKWMLILRGTQYILIHLPELCGPRLLVVVEAGRLVEGLVVSPMAPPTILP